MEKSNFALRLLPSLHKAAQRVAEREDCSVNQLINIALAEKLAVLDEEYWKDRAKSVKVPGSVLLRRLAGDEPPREGDEVPSKPIHKPKNRQTKAQAAGARHT